MPPPVPRGNADGHDAAVRKRFRAAIARQRSRMAPTGAGEHARGDGSATPGMMAIRPSSYAKG